MINLFNKKQEKKKALSLDDLRFISTNHPNQEIKDEAGKMLVSTYVEKSFINDLKRIIDDEQYSLKTRILAGEKYLEHLSSLDKYNLAKPNEFCDLACYDRYPEKIREKAGIKYADYFISEGNSSQLSGISKNPNYPLEVRNYSKNNFNLAIENNISSKIKEGDFDYLLSLEKDQEVPANLRDKARESVKSALEIKLKSSYVNEIPDYFFEIAKHESLPESIKDWLKKEGTKIAIKNVETFYAHNNYSNLKNYSYWSWVPQEVQELSKKKLEELAVEMGKKL